MTKPENDGGQEEALPRPLQRGDRAPIAQLNRLRELEGMAPLSQAEYDAAGKEHAQAKPAEQKATPIKPEGRLPLPPAPEKKPEGQTGMGILKTAGDVAAVSASPMDGLKDLMNALDKMGPIGGLLKMIVSMISPMLGEAGFGKLAQKESAAVPAQAAKNVFATVGDKIFESPGQKLSGTEAAQRLTNVCKEMQANGEIRFDNVADEVQFYAAIPAAMQDIETLDAGAFEANHFSNQMNSMLAALDNDAAVAPLSLKQPKHVDPDTVYNQPVVVSSKPPAPSAPSASAAANPVFNPQALVFKDNGGAKFEVHRISPEDGQLEVMGEMTGAELLTAMDEGKNGFKVEQYVRGDGSRGYFFSDDKGGVYVAGDVLDRAAMDQKLIAGLNTEAKQEFKPQEPAPGMTVDRTMQMSMAPGMGMGG